MRVTFFLLDQLVIQSPIQEELRNAGIELVDLLGVIYEKKNFS